MENIALLFLYNIHHIYLRYTFWFDYVYVGWRKCVWTNIFVCFKCFFYMHIYTVDESICRLHWRQYGKLRTVKMTYVKKTVGFPRQCGLCGPWYPERAIKFNHSPTLSTGMCGLILCHWDGSFKTKKFYAHKLWKNSVLGTIKIRYKSYIWKISFLCPKCWFCIFLFTNTC